MTESKEIARLGVILEDMDSKLDILVEGQGGLQRQIEHVDGKLEEFRKEANYKFEIVFEEFTDVRKDLSGVHTELRGIHQESKTKAERI